MRNICVIGSCSMDLVVTSDKRPKAGETVLARHFRLCRAAKEQIRPLPQPDLGRKCLWSAKLETIIMEQLF